MTAGAALALCVFIASLGSLVTDAELLSLHKHLRVGGLLSPSGFLYRRFRPHRFWGRLLYIGLHNTPVLLIVIGRFAVSIWCIYDVCTHRPLLTPLTAYVLVTIPLLIRGGLGNNGSDQMLHLILVSSWLGLLVGTQHSQAICLGFITCQLSLAYLTAALVKIISPGWRSGHHLKNILSLYTFGHPFVLHLLTSNDLLFRVSNTICLSWEFSMGAALWLPPGYCAFFLLCGLAFHTAVAFTMGLNTFLPAFAAAYPAALFISLALWR